jgi:hypothetical protein
MGFLILGLLGYFFLRQVMPNAAFYVVMTADSRILVILLLIISLVTGVTHIPLADLVLFPLGLFFAITVFESYSQSRDDVPHPSPFVASLASRAPPLF